MPDELTQSRLLATTPGQPAPALGEPARNEPVTPSKWVALTLIALLAPALAGGAAGWAEAILLGLLGLLLLVSPPRYSLGRKINLLCGALLAIALLAFLPAAWFGLPAWRLHGAVAVSLPLPATLTPQPWLTGEAILLLIGGIAWFHLLGESQVRTLDRSSPMRGFVIGIALLSAVSIYLYSAGIPWPFPESVARFGPFPNKNQMATVMAIGALCAFACIYDAVRFHRRVIWWILAACVNLAGLVLANSRGAIITFLLGLVAWLVALALVTRSRTLGATGLATISILLLGFVLFGGASTNRFHERARGGEDMSQDLRWTIQKDALAMSLSSPLVGIGAGEFHSVFALWHHALGSADVDVIHPESDWLWFIDEMGWPAFCILFAGGLFCLSRALPLQAAQENWHLRAAGLAAGLIFLLHGFADVAGHRLGSAFVALFAMSFAAPSGDLAALRTRSSICWRLAGLLLLAAGAVALWAIDTGSLLPGSVGVALVKDRAPRMNDGGRYQDVSALTTRALQWAPMDWELYYDRAVAEARMNGVDAARADFQRARFLQPTTPDLPYNEGLVWMTVRPALLFQAWQEALRRGASDRATIYERMISAAGSSQFLPALRRLADKDADLKLTYCARAPREEAARMINEILQADPALATLSADQKRLLFKLWAVDTNPADAVRQILARDDWLSAGWPIVVAHLVSVGDYRRAYEITRRFASPPAVPRLAEAAGDPAELASRVYADPPDFVAGLALCEQYQQSGDNDDALILVARMAALPGCPRYIFALEAELLAGKQAWQQAFESLQKSLRP